MSCCRPFVKCLHLWLNIVSGHLAARALRQAAFLNTDRNLTVISPTDGLFHFHQRSDSGGLLPRLFFVLWQSCWRLAGKGLQTEADGLHPGTLLDGEWSPWQWILRPDRSLHHSTHTQTHTPITHSVGQFSISSQGQSLDKSVVWREGQI